MGNTLYKHTNPLRFIESIEMSVRSRGVRRDKEIWGPQTTESVRVRPTRERRLQGLTMEAKSCGGDAREPMSPPPRDRSTDEHLLRRQIPPGFLRTRGGFWAAQHQRTPKAASVAARGRGGCTLPRQPLSSSEQFCAMRFA